MTMPARFTETCGKQIVAALDQQQLVKACDNLLAARFSDPRGRCRVAPAERTAATAPLPLAPSPPLPSEHTWAVAAHRGNLGGIPHMAAPRPAAHVAAHEATHLTA